MYTRVRDGGGGRGLTGGVDHGRRGKRFRGWIFWQGRLGRAHLSGMYPSLLYNRGFDACSTMYSIGNISLGHEGHHGVQRSQSYDMWSI